MELDIDMSSTIKQDLFNRCAAIKSWSSVDDVTAPMLFVNNSNIGGLDEVYALIENGSFADVVK